MEDARLASVSQKVREQKNLDRKCQIMAVGREDDMGLGPEEESKRVTGDCPRLRTDLGL